MNNFYTLSVYKIMRSNSDFSKSTYGDQQSPKKFSMLFLWSVQYWLKNFLEPAMFCHLAVLIYLCGERQGKRPKVNANQKGSKNFFSTGIIVKNFYQIPYCGPRERLTLTVICS